jgi:hypothetical protein
MMSGRPDSRVQKLFKTAGIGDAACFLQVSHKPVTSVAIAALNG